MAKYQVTVHQTVYQRTTLIIEAEGQKLAKAAARSLVFSGDDIKIGWDTTESEFEFDVEEDESDDKPDIEASDFDDLDDWLDDCDDTSGVPSIAKWMKKRWRVELHPKKGIEAEVSIVARDLTHAEAMELVMEHNDGPYPTWARMEEEEANEEA